jgi:uncharacterized membrane protein
MKAAPLLIAFLLATAIAPASARGDLILRSSTSRVRLSENWGTETITLHYWILRTPENILQDAVFVYGDLQGVTVFDNKGELDFREENWGAFRVVEFDLREPLKAGDISIVTIEFRKAASVADEKRRYEIRYLWRTIPLNIRVMAILPKEYKFTLQAGEDTSVSTINGEWRLEWSKERENHFFAAISFELKFLGELGDTEGIPGPPLPPYVPLAAAILVLLVTAGVSAMLRPTMPKPIPPKPARRFSREDVRRMMLMLTGHERKVVEVLLKEDNLTQRVLCDRTKIPKATMSRVLQRLENKGIISRMGVGASKRVLLTRWARRWRVK